MKGASALKELLARRHSRSAEIKKLAFNYNCWMRDRNTAHEEEGITGEFVLNMNVQLEELSFVMDWDDGMEGAMA